MKKLFSVLILLSLFIILTYFNNDISKNENLINKVNAVENQWINYKGVIKSDNQMIQSQFIPYDANEDYQVNNDTYVSYYNGEDFIKTALHEGNKSEVQSVEEADGVILSFNKENKSGIKLVRID